MTARCGYEWEAEGRHLVCSRDRGHDCGHSVTTWDDEKALWWFTGCIETMVCDIEVRTYDLGPAEVTE